MIYTGYEILWLFFAGSFGGWCLETVRAAFKRNRFVNRGLVNGPFCVIYGIVLVALTLFYRELPLFWLFCGAAILGTVVEWIAGHLIEQMWHERWWDYSDVKWNLDGYICFPMSMLWGALGLITVRWGNGLMVRLFRLFPDRIQGIVIWALVIGIAVDIAATVIIISGKSGSLRRWERIDRWFTGVSLRIGRRIYGLVEGRIDHAYPRIRTVREKERSEAFAAGCCFYKIMWLFVIGSFLGDITETIFCRLKAGVWMSRSSLVWGPFSIVWGIGIAAVTAMLYRYRDRSDRFLFLMGTALGGAYEYLCSVLSELVFGTVFWDYSNIPFNLGGRINLLYCFFWGIAVVVWLKGCYPFVSSKIEKLPRRTGTVLTWCLIFFMSANMAVSAMALVRSDQRSREVPAAYEWQEVMDERFPDSRLEKIYPNAIKV